MAPGVWNINIRFASSILKPIEHLNWSKTAIHCRSRSTLTELWPNKKGANIDIERDHLLMVAYVFRPPLLAGLGSCDPLTSTFCCRSIVGEVSC